MTSGPPSPPPPGETSEPPSIVSNWQFSTTSKVAGTIAGSMTVSGTSVSGVVHIFHSNCFDRLAITGLSGALTGDDISMTSTPVGGQVMTLTGSFTDDALSGTTSPGQFTGTYIISGGCGDGDQGNITGLKIPYIPNSLNGTFTASGGETFNLSGGVAQNSAASSEGSFGIAGTVAFTTPCFNSGTITPGTFPSGSFIIGTSVALVIVTDNGTVTFLGDLVPHETQINGQYTVLGGTCDQSGTAALVTSSPWDY